MLIKEYRIPLPLSLEEYRIAQLYMIQRKSREESEGEGSAVEFLENRPYTDGPNGSGQYTYKVYHIGRHIPSWFRSMVPKSALEVHEEAWNAYPYTRTRFSVPFVDKFSMEVETYFHPDAGQQENIFDLKGSELRQREVDVLDIVNDQLSGGDYVQEEDPRVFVSRKTGRGPLSDTWVQHPPNGTIMCAYKLIKVEFKYWGLQSKVERFIHDYGLRRVMLRAHRQAWAWQDDWVGLTMEDIRRLERETQVILQRKLGRVSAEEEENLEEPTVGKKEVKENVSLDVRAEGGDVRVEGVEVTPEGVDVKGEGVEVKGEGGDVRVEGGEVKVKLEVRAQPLSEPGSRLWERRQSSRTLKRARGSVRSERSMRGDGDTGNGLHSRHNSDSESFYSFRAEYGLDQIALLSDSDLEYFDAKESVSDSDSDYEEAVDGEGTWRDVLPDIGALDALEDSSSVQKPPSSPVAILILVIHGGSTLDSRTDAVGKEIDFQTFSENLRNVMELHFHSAIGRVALRMVPCPNLCNSALQQVVSLLPYPVSKLEVGVGLLPTLDSSSLPSASPTQSLPVGVLPLLAAGSHEYPNTLRAVAEAANQTYRDFLSSEEGKNFTGQVCLVADRMGSVVAYDILSSPHLRSATPSPPPLARKHNSSFSGKLSSMESPLSSSCVSLTSTGSATVIRQTSCTEEGSSVFQFEVSDFFAFGSPLGLILASRKDQAKHTANSPPPYPQCTAFYNLFYGMDVLAYRLEPLLDQRFSDIAPAAVPSYHHHPRGPVACSSLKETVVRHPYLFGSQALPVPRSEGRLGRKSVSSESLSSPHSTLRSISIEDIKPFSVWWSKSRIDYILETPRGSDSLDLLRPTAFAHIVHSRYWEAKELCSFILTRVLHNNYVCTSKVGRESMELIPTDSTVKWNRRRTAMKIQRLSSNHRASDVLAVVSGPAPTLHAKFQYGPLDMASLSREIVDVYILGQGPSAGWQYLDSVTTDKHGRVTYALPEDQALPPGLYPIRFLVRGDHTMASCNLFIVPPHTEAVVFSVDGALASNFSIMGKDMRPKPGAVDVARCWQDLGYLIVYVTGRPDWQKGAIRQFLGAHSFPLGLVFCAESLSTDAHIKTLYLARLIKEVRMIIHRAYGSQRHLATYRELGLQPDQIYIHAKKPRRQSGSEDCQYLTEGLAIHLDEIHSSPPRPAMADTRSLLGTTYFTLPGQQKQRKISQTASPKPKKRSRTLESTV